MPYVEKLCEVDAELERLQRELENTVESRERNQITAAMAVLRRQRRWYASRSPRHPAGDQPDQS